MYTYAVKAPNAVHEFVYTLPMTTIDMDKVGSVVVTVSESGPLSDTNHSDVSNSADFELSTCEGFPVIVPGASEGARGTFYRTFSAFVSHPLGHPQVTKAVGVYSSHVVLHSMVSHVIRHLAWVYNMLYE